MLIQEKVRSHELKASRVKSEDTRADLLTKFFDPERHHKLIKLLPLSVPGTTRGGKLSSVVGGVLAVTSQSYSRQSD